MNTIIILLPTIIELGMIKEVTLFRLTSLVIVYYNIIIPHPRLACGKDTVVIVLVSVCVCVCVCVYVLKSFKLCALTIDIFILKQKWCKAYLFSASTVCCLCRKMFCWQRNCSFSTISQTGFSCHIGIFDAHAYYFHLKCPVFCLVHVTACSAMRKLARDSHFSAFISKCLAYDDKYLVNYE